MQMRKRWNSRPDAKNQKKIEETVYPKKKIISWRLPEAMALIMIPLMLIAPPIPAWRSTPLCGVCSQEKNRTGR
jgi:hypothetical protein